MIELQIISHESYQKRKKAEKDRKKKKEWTMRERKNEKETKI